MTEPISEPRKSRQVAGLVILLVFAAGVAVGFFVRHQIPWGPGPHGLAVGGPPPGHPGVRGRMLERLDRELKLTPDQHARIDSVLTRRESDLHALMTETRPRFDSIAARTRAEIQAVLTPEQRGEFEKIVQQIESHRRRTRP
jgi:Spy/CpxP family protein refolding chaperone